MVVVSIKQHVACAPKQSKAIALNYTPYLATPPYQATPLTMLHPPLTMLHPLPGYTPYHVTPPYQAIAEAYENKYDKSLAGSIKSELFA